MDTTSNTLKLLVNYLAPLLYSAGASTYSTPFLDGLQWGSNYVSNLGLINPKCFQSWGYPLTLTDSDSLREGESPPIRHPFYIRQVPLLIRLLP